MMSSRDNVNALFRKEKAEYIGLHDSPWGDTMRAWIEQGYPTRKVRKKVQENGKEVEKEVDEPLSNVELFGFDIVSVGGWFDTMPLKGVSELVEESDEWIVRRNGAGAALKYWKNKSGTPEHIDFRMNSREVWERDYRPHLLQPDPSRVNIDGSRSALAEWRTKNKWTYYGHLFIWENMRQSMGDYNLYQSLLLDPGWIHDYNRVYTDFFKAHYRILFEQAGIPDGIWMYEDLGYRGKLFCSPKLLDELIFPYYREMLDFFHSYGLPVVLHSCGYQTPALPLIVDAGFDGLNPMEVKAGCDVVEYARKYGDKLVFIGGCDARIFETNDRAVIRRGVTDLMKRMKDVGARWIFASDHSLSTNIRYDSYRYAVEVYRENMWY